jgi:hypothetical protein
MKQMIRERRKDEPLHEYMVKGINIGLAITTFNDALTGGDVSPQRERIATVIWNKIVPSMAALQVEVHDARPKSTHDLNAMLLSAGLDALPTEAAPAIEHEPEKDDSA